MLKMKYGSPRRWGALLLAVAAVAVLPYSLGGQTPSSPSIKITELPPAAKGGPDEMFPISGEVSGADTKGLSVVIYVQAGGTWFVQPFADSYWTEIKTGGKWETETHGGTTYAALLVRKSDFKAPAQVRALPTAGVVARDLERAHQ
jgi:hypothetical protein